MGATPELRDLAKKYGYKVTSADKSPSMYRAMTLLAKEDTGKEIFIEGDWLKMPGNEKYDLILAHDSFNMLAWKDWAKLLRRLNGITKKNGCVISQILLPIKSHTAEKVLELYENGKIKTKPDLIQEVFRICQRPGKKSVNINRGVKSFLNIAKNKRKYRFIEKFRVFNSKPIVPKKEEAEMIFRKHFKISEICFAGDYEYCKFEPIYLLKKLRKIREI